MRIGPNVAARGTAVMAAAGFLYGAGHGAFLALVGWINSKDPEFLLAALAQAEIRCQRLSEYAEDDAKASFALNAKNDDLKARLNEAQTQIRKNRIINDQIVAAMQDKLDAAKKNLDAMDENWAKLRVRVAELEDQLGRHARARESALKAGDTESLFD